MRTILVTGGAGFVGSHLVDQLLEDGASVRVFDNLSTGSLQNLQAAAQRHSRVSAGSGNTSNGSRLEVIIGDIRDREMLRTALRDVKYVFHLAALPASAASVKNPGEIHAVNVEGTLNVLQGASQRTRRSLQPRCSRRRRWRPRHTRAPSMCGISSTR